MNIMFMIFSLALAVLGLTLVFKARRIRKTYALVVGKVVHHEGKGTDGWLPVIVFRYQNKEIMYVSPIGSAWTARLPVGSTCPIYVNPENIYDIHDARPGYFWMSACSATFFGLVVALLAYKGLI